MRSCCRGAGLQSTAANVTVIRLVQAHHMWLRLKSVRRCQSVYRIRRAAGHEQQSNRPLEPFIEAIDEREDGCCLGFQDLARQREVCRGHFHERLAPAGTWSRV